MNENTAKPPGFYVKATWRDLGTVVLALALVLVARWLWLLQLGGLGLGAGVFLWWAGVAVFFRWVALHSLAAADYPSWVIRILAVLGMSWLFLWALEQAGLQAKWASWMASSIIVIMAAIVIAHLWSRRTTPDQRATPPQPDDDR